MLHVLVLVVVFTSSNQRKRSESDWNEAIVVCVLRLCPSHTMDMVERSDKVARASEVVEQFRF